MADPPKSKKKVKDEAFLASQRLMKERPEFEESWKLVLEEWTGIVPNFKLTHTPDRTIAIVLSTIVEHALERALCTHFVISKQEHLGLFHGQGDEDAPLHSFASKIALGYALGVHEQRCRTELRWIKNIRNAFAHSGQHLAFDTPDVALMVKALQTPGHIKWENIWGFKATTPRDKFIEAVKVVFMFLAIDLPSEKGQPKRFTQSEFYSLVFLTLLKPSS